MHKDLDISMETRIFIQKAMKTAIAHGTGRVLCLLKDMEIGGKTGTAQTNHRSKHGLGGEFLPHGWFACYARYKTHDPIVLVIMVEHAGSSSVPAAMAKNFFVKYCKIMDGEPLVPVPAAAEVTPEQVPTNQPTEPESGQTPVAQPQPTDSPTGPVEPVGQVED